MPKAWCWLLVPSLLLGAAGVDARARATPPSSSAAGGVCVPAVKWRWDGAIRSPAMPHVCAAPLVVQLTDDNGDGRIDGDDAADVVFSHVDQPRFSGQVTAVDGRTGAELWTTAAGVDWSLAAGDLDGDGSVEILAYGLAAVHAYDRNGGLLWKSETIQAPGSGFGVVGIGVANLDACGAAEVYVGSVVLDHLGNQVHQGGGAIACPKVFAVVSAAADLRDDYPGLELLAGNTLYAADGTTIWQQASLGNGFVGIADLDLDGEPEIVLAGATTLAVLDPAGSLLAPVKVLAGDCLTPPVIADIDGDGSPEVVVFESSAAMAMKWTGSDLVLLWSRPVADPSGLSGGTAFDLDGDGAAEVFYRDELRWYIFDGRTGNTLSAIDFPSSTELEYPVVADIDGDCEAEVLVSGCIGGDALVAYDCPGAAPARAMWNEHGYHATNVGDDGSIPPVEPKPWLAAGVNTWQAQVEAPCGAPGRLDDGRPAAALRLPPRQPQAARLGSSPLCATSRPLRLAPAHRLTAAPPGAPRR